MDAIIEKYCDSLKIEKAEIKQTALEYCRLAEADFGPQTLARLNLHKLNLIVVCLDIAAKKHGINIEKKTAIKLTGLRNQQYNSCFNTIKCKLNDVGENPDGEIQKYMVMNNLSSCDSMMQKIFKMCTQREEFNMVPEYDLKIASLFVASRNSKLKVNKGHLSSIHNMQSTVFNKLVMSVNSIFEQIKQTESQQSTITEPEEKIETQKIDDYESWKQKILSLPDD